MSLRNQIALLLAALSVAFVAVTYGVQTLVVMPAFARLERQAAERNVGRCVDAIERDTENLSNCANVWAAWDDTCRYVGDHNAEFAQQNLINKAFVSAHVNFICILDNRRQIVWSEARDLETLELIEVPALRALLQEDTSPFAHFPDIDDAKTGIELTQHGPLLLAARPIITSQREGPTRGAVVMGLFLNAQEVASLADRTHVDLDIWTVTQEDMPAEARSSLEMLQREPGTLFESVDSQTLHAYTVLDDVRGQPALLLRVGTPRDATAQGRVSARVATGCSLLGGLLAVVAMGLVLQRRIVGPLQHMADHAVRVGRRDDPKARLRLARRDEIGTLAGAFDRLAEHLAASRKKVLESAHRGGTAEIASDVRHSVSNAANAANCAVKSPDQRLQISKQEVALPALVEDALQLNAEAMQSAQVRES